MSSIFEQTGRISFGEQFSKLNPFSKDEESKATVLPMEYPADANKDLHKDYYKKYGDSMKNLYKEKGMEIPDFLSNATSYIKHRMGGGAAAFTDPRKKVYGGKIQPRGSARSMETR